MRVAVPMITLAVPLMLFPAVASGFECPKHFQTADAAIQKVEDDMGGGMAKMMDKHDMMLVHTLLDDAKMLLAGARHTHDKPQGDYDHARAIAKAEAARGYAEAADILHFRMMKAKKH